MAGRPSRAGGLLAAAAYRDAKRHWRDSLGGHRRRGVVRGRVTGRHYRTPHGPSVMHTRTRAWRPQRPQRPQRRTRRNNKRKKIINNKTQCLGLVII